jgi:hypothetical protein
VLHLTSPAPDHKVHAVTTIVVMVLSSEAMAWAKAIFIAQLLAISVTCLESLRYHSLSFEVSYRRAHLNFESKVMFLQNKKIVL